MTTLVEKEKRLADLIVIRDKMLEEHAHWKSCQDGSYEMALSMAGIDPIVNEIISLEKELKG
jgi:hypothetical protein